MTQASPHQRDLAGESWNPGQYLKFEDNRLRPALDLMGRIPLENPQVVYDLGCGSGNVTRLLADRWPAADVVGMDNSPEMLAQAAADSDGSAARIRWQTGDLAGWRPDATPSVLYSNAVIQWVPDHDELVPRLWAMLPPGGCLAVQAPLSWDMRSSPDAGTLADGGRADRPSARGSAAGRRQPLGAGPRFYYDLLAPQSAHLDVWTTEYQHVLTGDDAVLEWVTGTGLRPILNGLDDNDRETYLAIPPAIERGVSQTGRRRYPLSLPPAVLRGSSQVTKAERCNYDVWSGRRRFHRPASDTQAGGTGRGRVRHRHQPLPTFPASTTAPSAARGWTSPTLSRYPRHRGVAAGPHHQPGLPAGRRRGQSPPPDAPQHPGHGQLL